MFLSLGELQRQNITGLNFQISKVNLFYFEHARGSKMQQTPQKIVRVRGFKHMKIYGNLILVNFPNCYCMELQSAFTKLTIYSKVKCFCLWADYNIKTLLDSIFKFLRSSFTQAEVHHARIDGFCNICVSFSDYYARTWLVFEVFLLNEATNPTTEEMVL